MVSFFLHSPPHLNHLLGILNQIDSQEPDLAGYPSPNGLEPFAPKWSPMEVHFCVGFWLNFLFFSAPGIPGAVFLNRNKQPVLLTLADAND
jgi:hypothetical protein